MQYLWMLFLVDIVLDRVKPVLLITLIDGIDLSTGFNPHVAIRQDELAD